MKNQNSQESIDKNRRKFLTAMLIGSGAFLIEKVLTPLFSRFSNDSPTPTKTDLPNKTNLLGFRVTENKKGLSVYDSSGEEILQIDKET